jgi:hypothetical protein
VKLRVVLGKKPNLGTSSTGRRETADVNSHITRRVPAVALRSRLPSSMIGARYGMCELALRETATVYYEIATELLYTCTIQVNFRLQKSKQFTVPWHVATSYCIQNFSPSFLQREKEDDNMKRFRDIPVNKSKYLTEGLYRTYLKLSYPYDILFHLERIYRKNRNSSGLHL